MVSKTLIMVALVLFFSCRNVSKKEAKAAEKPKMEHNEHQMTQVEATLGPEFTSKYVCPMHCEGSKRPIYGSDILYFAIILTPKIFKHKIFFRLEH